MGASGDLATLKCIIDRKAERVADNASSGKSESCIIAKFLRMKYDNPYLQNNSLENILTLYKNGGTSAVNEALNNNSDSYILGNTTYYD